MNNNQTMLQLNFSPLMEQNFSFIIYRKERKENEKRENFSFGVHGYNLPRTTEIKNEKYEKYWVSNTEQENFKPFECTPFINNALTINFLLHELEQKCNATLKTDDFFTEYSFATKKINFVLSTQIEGKQVVWVEPYYLKESAQFGFLIDFTFNKNEAQAFNKNVQILSLSLDKSGKSNTSLYFDKYQHLYHS